MIGRATGFRSSGFSLLELLIVLVLIGILAAVAYPSYQEQVRATRRAEAGAVLLENAQLLERHYTRQGAYDSGEVRLVGQSPATGTAVYTVERVLSREAYRLEAKAVAGGLMAGDACQHLTLNQLGQRTPADAKCWRR